MAELHINVGLVALSRGFLSLDAFAEGINSLVTNRAVSIRELWVRPGRLDEWQLAQVMTTLGPETNRDTMLYSVDLAPVKQVDDGLPVVPDPATAPVRPASLIPATPATAPTGVSMVPPMPEQVAVGRAPTVRTTPPMNVETIGQRYRKLALLGSGGLGEVTACEDSVLNRTVAVKAAHQKSELDAASARLILLREARIISHLEHPNIIPIYDAGNDPASGPYYVMRQVTETSLEAILRRRRLKEGDPHQYTLSRLLRYFLQVCNAVDYAHHRGVIHCDIKPANVLLGDYGEVLLVDWGLAQSPAHPLGVRGGTLGYMAPEQMDSNIERFDARTDVFALGAILYEILAGRSAFPEVKSSSITNVGRDSIKLYVVPPPPSKVTTDPEVIGALKGMPEIEDLCLKALAVSRDSRLGTARALADAIDEFIEGSKQKQRQRIEADRNADAGDELAERYHEFVEARNEKLAVTRTLRADVAPWAPTEDKQDLWDSEDIVRVTDALQVRTFQSAVSAYERALDAQPGHARARKGLAKLYLSELRLARKRGDALHEIANEQMLREVDDGELARELQRDGALHVAIDGARRVTLAKLVERDRRLVEASAETIFEASDAQAGAPISRELPADRYVVTATFDVDMRPVVWPVRIDPGQTEWVTVSLLSTDLGPDDVIVPAGPARLAGDLFASDPEEPFVLDVPAFVIQRYPVSVKLWMEFLAAVRAADPMSVAAHEPRMAMGLPGPEVSPERMPVFGISGESAEAFARWFAKRENRAWRLPTEIEWEKAARGTDGRVFPWGDHFDATFCKMRDSRPGQTYAEPMGTFPSDISPYGVCDLAGGVADWCTPDPRRTAPRPEKHERELVSRGGSWVDWSTDCRSASRRRHLITERSLRVGLRLARDL